MIRLNDITLTFADGDARITAIDRVSLATHPATVTGITGPSGSGKSSLLAVAATLIRPDSGEVLIDGVDVGTLNATEATELRREKIGIVFQAYNLFPHMTVLQNVMLAPRKALGLSRDEAEERARPLLRRIGLEAKADEFPDRLSGGQQQRVAIVRALAMQPKLMLLDEITSALDPELVTEVLDLVRELKSEGTTIVMATHEMAFARDVADRVVFLDKGVVAEAGTPAEVFGAPREDRTREFLARFTG